MDREAIAESGVWGEPIEKGSHAWPVRQRLPWWLSKDDWSSMKWESTSHYGDGRPSCIHPHTIWLHADHPAYLAIREGLMPFPGGPEPGDWNGGPVLGRHGVMIAGDANLRWTHSTGADRSTDIIGYFTTEREHQLWNVKITKREREAAAKRKAKVASIANALDPFMASRLVAEKAAEMLVARSGWVAE